MEDVLLLKNDEDLIIITKCVVNKYFIPQFCELMNNRENFQNSVM